MGVVSARRILAARRVGPLRIEQLPKLGVVMKRAQYFLTASGRLPMGFGSRRTACCEVSFLWSNPGSRRRHRNSSLYLTTPFHREVAPL